MDLFSYRLLAEITMLGADLQQTNEQKIALRLRYSAFLA